MKQTFLIILVVVVGGMATAGARGPLKATRDEICSVKAVLLGGEFGNEAYAHGETEIPESDDYRHNKEVIEKLTWLRVVGSDFGWANDPIFQRPENRVIPPHHPRDAGILTFYSVPERVAEAHSRPTGATAHVGLNRRYTLTLKDPNGKILWEQSKVRFQGVEVHSGTTDTYERDVDTTNSEEWVEMARKLNEAVKGCETK
jgi:hypothetical protein